MNKPVQPNQLTVFEILGYFIALLVTLFLLRWSWNRFDGIALLVAVASPLIGLVIGFLVVLMLGCGVVACGYFFSDDFRREINDSKKESSSSPNEEDETV